MLGTRSRDQTVMYARVRKCKMAVLLESRENGGVYRLKANVRVMRCVAVLAGDLLR